MEGKEAFRINGAIIRPGQVYELKAIERQSMEVLPIALDIMQGERSKEYVQKFEQNRLDVCCWSMFDEIEKPLDLDTLKEYKTYD